MEDFKSIAKAPDIKPGERKILEVDGRSIAIFNLNGEFYAIENRCTHMEAELGRGILTENIIKCPWHGWKFNIKDGSCVSTATGQGVDIFEVKVEGEDIKVKINALPDSQMKNRYPFLQKQ